MNEFVQLDDVIESAQSGFASGERAADGVVQLRMNNVTTKGALDWSNVLRVPGTKKQVEKYHLLPGDILFNATNSPNLVGKTAVFKGYQEPIVFSNHFVRLRVDSTKVDSNYLGLWFTRQWQLHIFEHLCTQWVNQATVRKEDLLLLKVPLPSLPEQRRIAARLDKADHLRRTRRYAAQLSDTFLQAVFVRMFGNPVKNEMGWEQELLADLCLPNGIKAGPFGSSLKKEFYSKSGIRIYGQEQVIGGSFAIGDYYISEEMFEDFKQYEVKAGDILISLVGTLGKVIVVPQGIERGIINPRLLKVSPNPEKLNSVFLAHFIQHPITQSRLSIVSHGGTMDILNAGLLKELRTIAPPPALQQKFARIVQQFEHLRAQQREAERQAEHLFQALLHRAFS